MGALFILFSAGWSALDSATGFESFLVLTRRGSCSSSDSISMGVSKLLEELIADGWS